MSNTFDVNILVNGSRCKQYQHEGKVFVQANPGSEYTIEIKNNYWKRILGVCAVDGLNVLDGKRASENDNGYVIDSYHSEKIRGFRISDDEWALFKFGYKFNGKTYAQSKGDDSEKNCGVIGVRLYYEYEPVTYTYTYPTYIYQYPTYPQWPNYPYPWGTWVTTGAISGTSGGYATTTNGAYYTSNVNYACSNNASPLRSVGNTATYTCNASDQPNICCSANVEVPNTPIDLSNVTFHNTEIKPKGFDMGTEFGRKEASKIQTVSFSRGYLAHSLDIYYASRESLIEMGVPITKELKVNLPQSFPGKYCEPPRGWQG